MTQLRTIVLNQKFKKKEGINSLQSSLKSHPLWVTLLAASQLKFLNDKKNVILNLGVQEEKVRGF